MFLLGNLVVECVGEPWQVNEFEDFLYRERSVDIEFVDDGLGVQSLAGSSGGEVIRPLRRAFPGRIFGSTEREFIAQQGCSTLRLDHG